MVTILPIESNSFFTDIKADFYVKKDVWREITEENYDYAHGAVPPEKYGKFGGFLMGEAFSGDVYGCFVAVGDKFFAKYVEFDKMDKEVAKLKIHQMQEFLTNN